MASKQELVDQIVEQIESAGKISFRKMFGEYGIYCGSKMVAVICDNQLFVKPTPAGNTFVGDIKEAPPYKGAKMYYLIDEKIDDRDWLTQLIKITAQELPEPKPKKKKGGIK